MVMLKYKVAEFVIFGILIYAPLNDCSDVTGERIALTIFKKFSEIMKPQQVQMKLEVAPAQDLLGFQRACPLARGWAGARPSK